MLRFFKKKKESRYLNARFPEYQIGKWSYGKPKVMSWGEGAVLKVGAFFTVDLDIDKIPVHDGRSLRVFERFVRHHMTPVTGSIADAQEDGFIFIAGFTQRCLTPRIPVDRVVSVLQQIGGIFVAQVVVHNLIIIPLFQIPGQAVDWHTCIV